MQKKYRNQISEKLCNYVHKIMIFKNLILFSVCACVGGKAGFKSGA